MFSPEQSKPTYLVSVLQMKAKRLSHLLFLPFLFLCTYLSVTFLFAEVIVCRQSPDRTVPRLTFSWGQIPEWQLSDGHFSNRIIPWPDTSSWKTSLIGHFSTRVFPRPYFSNFILNIFQILCRLLQLTFT